MTIYMRSGILGWFLLGGWFHLLPPSRLCLSIANRFAATIIGSPPELQAELPADIPASIGEVTVFPDRKCRRCSGW